MYRTMTLALRNHLVTEVLKLRHPNVVLNNPNFQLILDRFDPESPHHVEKHFDRRDQAGYIHTAWQFALSILESEKKQQSPANRWWDDYMGQ